MVSKQGMQLAVPEVLNIVTQQQIQLQKLFPINKYYIERNKQEIAILKNCMVYKLYFSGQSFKFAYTRTNFDCSRSFRHLSVSVGCWDLYCWDYWLYEQRIDLLLFLFTFALWFISAIARAIHMWRITSLLLLSTISSQGFTVAK